MNIPETLTNPDEAGVALRLAIGSGNFEDAQQVIRMYGPLVKRALQLMRGDEARIAALASDAKELLTWACREVSAARAQAAVSLGELRSTRCYLDTGRSGVQSWEIEA